MSSIPLQTGNGTGSQLTSGRQQAAARLSLASNAFLVLIKLVAGIARLHQRPGGRLQSSVDVLASALDPGNGPGRFRAAGPDAPYGPR